MTQSEFKWKHFAPEIILWSLRWYGTTALSYAYVSDMLAERGIFVNRSTIYRWFIEYSPNYVDINSRLLTLHGNLMKHMFE
ncbi:hypothetical protein AFI02nite_41740 [Aliivibrio fischeri]|uniref:IS6 family transposase n=1 Tax=Aliivibrio fischeri TaxID=668 RepID=A0A510UNB0_ALIFS|nr:hypothetical protein AFI02nite_41740 [Aliivibrio fischeri]